MNAGHPAISGPFQLAIESARARLSVKTKAPVSHSKPATLHFNNVLRDLDCCAPEAKGISCYCVARFVLTRREQLKINVGLLRSAAVLTGEHSLPIIAE